MITLEQTALELRDELPQKTQDRVSSCPKDDQTSKERDAGTETLPEGLQFFHVKHMFLALGELTRRIDAWVRHLGRCAERQWLVAAAYVLDGVSPHAQRISNEFGKGYSRIAEVGLIMGPLRYGRRKLQTGTLSMPLQPNVAGSAARCGWFQVLPYNAWPDVAGALDTCQPGQARRHQQAPAR
ncbi:hypothetical protein CC78DRAFT_613281 [Lojkania enalia]|uniref:Uncharacterized protein n=1 Tax=Lojkania enalia TaxID=147567 RepID=A0A9P4KH37_9PLEO|nr:hypothetical protein CC78DRAFT_613281 [Didymosphaeria enalia]